MIVWAPLSQFQAAGNQQQHMIQCVMPGKDSKAAGVMPFLRTADDGDAIRHGNVGKCLQALHDFRAPSHAGGYLNIYGRISWSPGIPRIPGCCPYVARKRRQSDGDLPHGSSPHTEFLMARVARAIADNGREGRIRLARFSTASALFGQRKLLLSPSTHGTGTPQRGVLD